MREFETDIVEDKVYSIQAKGGVQFKPFYTFAEMTAIMNDMQADIEEEVNGKTITRSKTALERYFSKVVLTGIYNTNINFGDMSDNDKFDLLSELGLPYEFSVSVDGFDDLDRFIKSDESIYNLLKIVADKLGTKLDGFDITALNDKLGGLKDLVK